MTMTVGSHHPQRRHRPGLAGAGCLRRAGPADARSDRAPHRATPLLGAPHARAARPAALAAPQRPRLRARHAAGRARIAGGAPGSAAPRRDPLPARTAPRHRPRRAPGGPRRLRRGVPGEDRRSDGRRHPHPRRRPPARALHRGRQGDPGVRRRRRRGRPVDPQDQVLDQPRRRNWRPNWPRSVRTASPSSARSRCPDSVVSQRRSATAGEAVAAVSVCGPMSRMTFDQRLAAPVRMTAMGIWRNVEDGPQRVAPTLQQVRPLRSGPAPVRGSAAAVRMSLDPQIAEISTALDAGFPPVHTMTGAQARAAIRSRFVPHRRPEAGRRGRATRRSRSGGRIAVRIYRPASVGPVPDAGLRAWRRVCVLRSGQPRRTVS